MRSPLFVRVRVELHHVQHLQPDAQLDDERDESGEFGVVQRHGGRRSLFLLRRRLGPGLIGLDTVLYSIEVLYESFNDSKYRPCPLLKKMVDAGLHGRKNGQGFYKYQDGRL